MEKDMLLIEEYKQIRGEIVDRERTITQLFVVAIVSSVSLLSAVGAIFFKIEPYDMQSLDPAYAYPFLGPLGIIIPILYVFISHRRDLHRSGTYLHVFFENQDLGPKWETRLIQYRNIQRGESLDYLIISFWVIYMISVAGFVFALYKIVGICYYCYWIIPVIIVVTSLYLMIIGHRLFNNASVNVRHRYYEIWEDIKRSQG